MDCRKKLKLKPKRVLIGSEARFGLPKREKNHLKNYENPSFSQIFDRKPAINFRLTFENCFSFHDLRMPKIPISHFHNYLFVYLFIYLCVFDVGMRGV